MAASARGAVLRRACALLVLLCGCNSGAAAGIGGSAGGVGAAGGRGGTRPWSGAGGTGGWAATSGWGGVGGARPWPGGGAGVAGSLGGFGGWMGAGGWAGASHWGGAGGAGIAAGWGGSSGSFGGAGLDAIGLGYDCDIPFPPPPPPGATAGVSGTPGIYCGPGGVGTPFWRPDVTAVCQDAAFQELLCCTLAGGCALQLGNTCVPNDDKSGWPPHTLGSSCPPATLNFDWLGNCPMAGCCRRDGNCGLVAPYSWGVCVDRAHFADRGLQPVRCNPVP